jgi:hypothetical protein
LKINQKASQLHEIKDFWIHELLIVSQQKEYVFHPKSSSQKKIEKKLIFFAQIII